MAYQKSPYIQMRGGLNLRASVMQMNPGQLLGAKNVECKTPTGYRRVDGYTLWDANEITGEGATLGGFIYGNTVYAFRNVVGSASAKMWKSTGGGWTEVDLGKTIDFTSGSTEIEVGSTIVGATSGATAVVAHVYRSSGSWQAGDAAGTLTIYTQVGTFQSEDLNISGGASNVASVGGDSTAVTLLPGGTYRFDKYNFNGVSKIYGVSGTNKAFEFDGTYYIQIRTGMADDTPDHVIGYKSHLFLSFGTSLQFSPIGEPTAVWTAVTGAGELLTESTVTGLTQVSTGALAIATRTGWMFLQGSSSADFVSTNMREYGNEVGCYADTLQQLGSRVVFFDDRGVMEIRASQNYGDFQDATLSQHIQDLIDVRIGDVVCSCVVKEKNQYRLFFDGGKGLTLGYYQDRVLGFAEFEYPVSVKWVATGESDAGRELAVFGTTTGYVYRMDSGNSFAGTAITTFLQTAYHSLGSPRDVKRWRSATLDLLSSANTSLSVKPDFRNVSEGVPPYSYTDINLYGAGSPLGSFVLGSSVLGGSIINEGWVELEGRGDFCSLILRSSSTTDDAWELDGIIYEVLPGRRRY